MRDKIVLRNISKVFTRDERELRALIDINIDVKEGEFLSIVGPSGCGKSTLLNIIAGLLKPTTGEISLDGQLLKGINTKIGYITQRDNLLPWRTTRGNIEIGLEIRGVAKSERKSRAMELIDRVGLAGFDDHFPNELSGGMRKRASLARTLIYNPDVFLMDEPFSAVDAQTRLILENQLLELWSGTGNTIIFVTHDLEEAISLSDRVIVFSARPGTAKAVNSIPLTRPRDTIKIRFNEDFIKIYGSIWKDLEEEVGKAEELKTKAELEKAREDQEGFRTSIDEDTGL
ncbi:MAG: ABC transporter ATP-binding protein [Syntrophobacterales bacterium]|nr:MAG: ABC transporter ATP-binding protein [Syntrophobacterales bacterium]